MSKASQKTDNLQRLYVMGFCWSVILTVAAYVAVVQQLLSRGQLLAYITILALLQVAVQLYFFLHLGGEPRPRWNLWTFLFMSSIMLIIVIGSLWIMHNLNYNMMPTMPADEMHNYMLEESNKGL